MAAKRRRLGTGGRGDDRNKNPEEIAEKRIEDARKSKAHSLDLSGLVLTELPASIGQLTQLQRLNVSQNRLTSLPEAIGQLVQLQMLDVSKNELIALLADFELQSQVLGERGRSEFQSLQGDLPNGVVSIGEFDKTESAMRAGEELDVPTFIRQGMAIRLSHPLGQLTQLQTLIASRNSLIALTETIGQLAQLQHLDVSQNRLTALPEGIGQLLQLKYLDVSINGLRSLPEALRRLPDLKCLYVRGNPRLGLPPEMQEREVFHYDVGFEGIENKVSPASILEFYFKTHGSGVGSRPLNEAKLILVGRGGVGKTCLVNRLVHGTYNPEEKKTDGIAITPWPLRVGKDDVRLNIWDFGGQEIMHATHQFFLTKRSLYMLVLNAREGEQDANVEYWLRLVESFGGDSPVLVAINKVADHPFDLNRRGLQAKFPAIRGFVQTDCKTKLGLEELRQAILRETDLLEHLRDPFPASWFTVKDTLANLPKNEGTNFIPFTRYQQLCAEQGVAEATSQEMLVGFLHDLGIVVNFRDNPRLSDTQVLDPEWVTNGIYKILNADWLEKRKGELRLEHLPGVLDRNEYPQAMHLYLLDLMRKFELCYEFYDGDGHYLVPELLGKEEPDLKEFAAADALWFEYRYNILPEGLLPRFIVRSRALNKNMPRWRTGVVLAWDGNRAVVKADVQDRRVSIAITGPLAGRRRLLAVIRADLEHIHGSIAKLQATEQVPVPGHPGLVVEYATLCILEAEGETELKLVNNGKMVKARITDLLSGVEEPSSNPREPMRKAAGRKAVRVAFSYSHKDEELRDQLETHLKLLQRQGVISTWHDRKILGGENWAGVIDDNFKRADLILLLVSADFLASDYCYETEMKLALEREVSGEARVVPVTLRACDWKGALFGKLQGFPKDMKPVTSWPNRDEAWTDVAAGIRKVAEQLRKQGA